MMKIFQSLINLFFSPYMVLLKPCVVSGINRLVPSLKADEDYSRPESEHSCFFGDFLKNYFFVCRVHILVARATDFSFFNATYYLL